MSKIMSREDIVASRGDLSPFLIHLTRDTPNPDFLNPYRVTQANKNLESIIRSTQLIAKDSFSFFKYVRTTPRYVQKAWLNSVCFTETPLKDIDIQLMAISNRQLHFQPYGLAFFEPAIRSAKGNPLFYIDSNHTVNIATLDSVSKDPNCGQYKDILHLFQTFGMSFSGYPKNIDFRWEREWRIQGNYKFNLNADVAFGLCPSGEIAFFEALTGNAIPFVDPLNYPVAKAKLSAWTSLRRFNF